MSASDSAAVDAVRTPVVADCEPKILASDGQYAPLANGSYSVEGNDSHGQTPSNAAFIARTDVPALRAALTRLRLRAEALVELAAAIRARSQP